MAYIGLCRMAPLTALSLLDRSKWQVVVYADTPVCRTKYHEFLQQEGEGKVCLFVIGSQNISAIKNTERFQSFVVFDSLTNLKQVQDQDSGFKIVDSDPEFVHSADLNGLLNAPGAPSQVLLENIKATLRTRRPSVLETTGKMPQPGIPPSSGVMRVLDDLKEPIEAAGIDFGFVVDMYAKFTFRIISSKKLGSVTRKLPPDIRGAWKDIVTMAQSETGLNMAKAFKSLCEANDPDYRVGNAIKKFGLTAYSGDFMYLTTMVSPSQANLPTLIPNA